MFLAAWRMRCSFSTSAMRTKPSPYSPKLRPGETVESRLVRFRTLGCYPLTGAIDSDADSLEGIVSEMLTARTSERQGRLIDRDEQVGSFVRCEVHAFERNSLQETPALGAQMPTGVVHHDAPHGNRSHSQEVLSVVPGRSRLIDQLEVRLVDERSRAQRSPVSLTAELAVREAAQLLVDDREDAIQHGLVAFADLAQEARDVVLVVHMRGVARFRAHFRVLDAGNEDHRFPRRAWQSCHGVDSAVGPIMPSPSCAGNA